MKHLPMVSRYALGVLFLVSGLAGLINQGPPPDDIPQALKDFTLALMATGYFFPFLKLTEAICGLMLIAGIAPALSLIILAPITLQIILLHMFLTPGPKYLILPIVIVLTHLMAAKGFWGIYKPLFGRYKKQV